MNAEDVAEIERAGRRCGVCHSGRAWRRFEIVRSAERGPVVLCGGCRVRFGDDLPVARKPEPAPEPAPAPAEPLSLPKLRAGKPRTERRPDRLRAALRKMPGSFSNAMAARGRGSADHQLARRRTTIDTGHAAVTKGLRESWWGKRVGRRPRRVRHP